MWAFFYLLNNVNVIKYIFKYSESNSYIFPFTNDNHSHLAIKNLKALRIRSSLSKCRAKERAAMLFTGIARALPKNRQSIC